MSEESLIVHPGKSNREVINKDGEILSPPGDWILLPPGDAALTRSVKKAGPAWQVQVKKGRKVFPKGVWAPEKIIREETLRLEHKRSTPEYKKKREADLKRRELRQEKYSKEFYKSILDFLDFHPKYYDIASYLAKAVTDHAVPVGSGTVARTERIPVEDRAAAAVIAWMRHQTTGYDSMKIPRIKGKRREVRRQLAQISEDLLDKYRRGEDVNPACCPVRLALKI